MLQESFAVVPSKDRANALSFNCVIIQWATERNAGVKIHTRLDVKANECIAVIT